MSSPEPLVVTVRRSGGLAGIRRSWTVAAADLLPPAAAQLRRLVAEADIGAAAVSGAGKPDAFSYAVEVAEGGRTRRTAWAGSTAGEAVRALVDFVLAHS